MCLAIPGKVTKIDGQQVTVDYGFEARQVLLGGETVKIGDFVMVQMGVVIKVLSSEEAAVAGDSWKAN